MFISHNKLMDYTVLEIFETFGKRAKETLTGFYKVVPL